MLPLNGSSGSFIASGMRARRFGVHRQGGDTTPLQHAQPLRDSMGGIFKQPHLLKDAPIVRKSVRTF